MDNPKGALVTNRSLTLATNVIYTIGYHLSGVDTILSFLPSISACLSLFIVVSFYVLLLILFYKGSRSPS